MGRDARPAFNGGDRSSLYFYNQLPRICHVVFAHQSNHEESKRHFRKAGEIGFGFREKSDPWPRAEDHCPTKWPSRRLRLRWTAFRSTIEQANNLLKITKKNYLKSFVKFFHVFHQAQWSDLIKRLTGFSQHQDLEIVYV